MHKYII